MWNTRTLAECVLAAPQDRGINVGPARDLARAALASDSALRAMIAPLATMAENELPITCEAATGIDWTARWRGRAQNALRLARETIR